MKIQEIISHNDKVLVLFNSFLPREIGMLSIYHKKPNFDERKLLIINEHLLINNNNVWCFDLDGNLVWKIPGAYSEESHQKMIKECGHRLVAPYIGMQINPTDNDLVTA